MKKQALRQIRKLSVVIVLAVFMNHAYGQIQRHFPETSLVGRLTASAFPEFVINGQTMYMGAGGQIRDVDNLIILPTMLDKTGFIRYEQDIMGNLHRVWFLTEEEANQAQQEIANQPK